MKNGIIDFNRIFLSLLIISLSYNLKSQTVVNSDSLIQITRVKSFLVNNPAPQYIIEIKSNRTISFYNILPENFSKDHPGFKGWFIDSTTINIDNQDYFELEKTINGIDLFNISTSEKRQSENEIEVEVTGNCSDNYIIETSNQKAEFSIDNYDKNISASVSSIRNIFEKLEEKYKPE